MIYRLTYCNKDGVEARVDIQKGLATPVIHIEGTERPFILSYNNDKGDKSGMFLSSSADIEIYETIDFNINNLKTSNETELSVTHYINNVISWQGFIIPDFFSIEVRNNPVITMTASDRLGTLKSVTLSDLPSMISLRELAILCLNKTGLTLPLKTMADFSNGAGVNDLFNSKILTQRLSDTKGRSISCYDILSSILTASNSFLVQRLGGWHIINKIQHEAGSGKLYTGATSFINWSDVIFNFSDISVGGRRTIIPVASTVGVFHEFGGGRIYPENYDFSLDLTGWTSVNGFVAVINNRKVDNFASGTGVIPQEWTTDPVFGDTTEKKYLVNDNYGINYDFANKPYLRSSSIPVTYPNISQVKVNVEVNATGPYIDSETYRGETNFAVIASNGASTLHLTGSGTFEPLSGDPFLHKVLFDGDTHLQAVTSSRSVNGVLAVQEGNLSGYNITIRIYGYTKGVTGGRFLVTTLVNSVAVTITDISDEAKGTLYKTERTDNYTKAHDIDTSLFADYLTTGLNGYFYSFPIDDTSLIYNSNNELTSKWTAYNDTEQLPLLQHITRQRSRLFSVAHDLLSAEIEISNFDPLAIFVSCGKRHTVVSAQFDFFKSNLSVELEEVAFQNATVRDFIYSYFGDGESGIKSIGGISGGGGGGGTGGGLTPEQIEILSWWKKDPNNPNTIFTEMNAYSKLELSAYGLGSGSGGGGGSLVTWGTTTNNFSPLTVEGISKTVALQGHTHSKSEVGLSNVDNVKQLPLSQKGAVGGVAELDENGKVLASQLPSYVDDVLEYANLAGFPTTGETGKIYTALDTNKIYRWSGSTYIEISSSLALGETSSTAYRGDRGKIAYEHSQSAHAPANAQKNSDITKAEIEAKLTGIITSHSHTVTKADVGLGNVLNVASYSKIETDSLINSINVGVTSIGLTAPTGFSVSNSPITSTGNIALAFATGYSLPTTAKQSNWDTAYSERHTHSNKAVIDGITSTLVTNWNDANTKKHTHANKLIIDKLTQANIDVLALLSIVDGNLKVNTNLWSVGEVSAYGLGSGSGGGGGGSLVSWGTEINSFIPLIIEGISKTVALQGHTHSKTEIGLGNVLNVASYSKIESDERFAPLAGFNLHVNDNIRHITSAERTKWNTVVTDFAGLEIGGRNLVPSFRSNQWTIGGNATILNDYEISFTKSTVSTQINIPVQGNKEYTISLFVGVRFYLSNLDENEGTINAIRTFFSSDTDIETQYITYTFRSHSDAKYIRFRISQYSQQLGVFPSVFRNIKLEKGNKATDWTPAPEDQVSDWNTTDINSFSYIKNKPTTLSQFTDNIGVATHIANNVIHITAQERINWNLAYSERHTHPNKPVIDQLTQADINVLAKLSLVDGNLKVDTNLYSTGEVSAYGIGSGSGGGGGDGTHVEWGATANNYSPLIVEGISKIVALQGHTHTKAQIGLGNVLNVASYSKTESDERFAPLAGFNLHVNDNIRHITSTERVKWDKAYSDIEGLEIGGVNLALKTSIPFFGTGTDTATIQLIKTNAYILSVNPILGDTYTVSFKAKATGSTKRFTPMFLGSQHLIDVLLTDEYKYYSNTIICAYSSKNIYFYGYGIQTLDVKDFKLEKGTIATDWTPAPEDQVSDWSTTDVNSFSFIKNKPILLSQFTDNIGVATHIANTSNPHSVTKSQVGLGSVDNTSDLNKPISTAMQTTLNLKANLANPTFTGTVTAPTFSGALTGNASSADNLNRSIIAGDGLSGGGVLNADRTITLGTPSILTASTTNAVTAGSHTHAITTTSVGLANTIVQTDASGGVRGEVIRIGANWTLELVGTELQVKYNGVLKQRFLADGSFVAIGEVTAYE